MGHPDVFDRFWFLTRGGLSKASRVINISEDIFAGFNCTLRGGNVTHHEYIQVGKGRDVGLNQISMFESKVASGNGEQVLSRDIYRLGHRLDFFRMLSFFYTTVGSFFNTMMIILTVYPYQYGVVYQLGIAAGSWSIAVYLLSWIYVVLALALYSIIAYARSKYAAKEHIYYRLVQFLVIILAVILMVALLEFTDFKFLDIFTSLLAFVPTGWGLISIAQVLGPFLQRTVTKQYSIHVCVSEFCATKWLCCVYSCLAEQWCANTQLVPTVVLTSLLPSLSRGIT